jgi:hypothetical protein
MNAGDIPQVQTLAVQAVAGVLLKAMVSEAMDFDPSIKRAVVTVETDEEGCLVGFCEYHAGPDLASAVIGGFSL